MPDAPSRYLRRRTIALYWSAQAIAAYVLLTPIMWTTGDAYEHYWWLMLPAGVLVIIAIQAALLAPVRKPRLAATGKSVLLSLAAAGAVVGILTAAAVGAIMGVYWVLSGQDKADEFWWIVGPAIAAAAGWIVSTPLLIAFCRRGSRESMVRRVASGLFVGTIIEAAAIIPLDVLVRRKDDCHCAAPSFIALCACGIAGLIAFGPAVFVPLIARRRKRWLAGRCETCGYDMTAAPNLDACPECGSGWRKPTLPIDNA